jgi:spectinomycin phosphotransferase
VERVMLEKPDIPDEEIIACMRTEYGLDIVLLEFLPLGADLNTAVYRGEAENGSLYFVKLRMDRFDETSAFLPKYLYNCGIRQVLAPLESNSRKLWADLGAFKCLLYPYIDGRNGYETVLTDEHWREFGATLKRIHTAEIPERITQPIRRERYSPRWRDSLANILEWLNPQDYQEPAARELAQFLQQERPLVLELVQRSHLLAEALKAQPADFVLCHSDIHAGNILIDTAGALYIIDWDAPILAPKERDLMYAGGAQFGSARTPQEEEALFYQGYGATNINQTALAYYRYERIIEDLAIYCEQLFFSGEGGEDRQQSLVYFKSNFLPGGTIEIAQRADRVA